MQGSAFWVIATANLALILLVFLVVPRVRKYMQSREAQRTELLRDLVASAKQLAESQAALTVIMTGLLESYRNGDRYAEGMMKAFQTAGETALRLEKSIGRFVDVIVRDAPPADDREQVQVLTEEDRDALYVQHTNADFRLNTEGMDESGAWSEKKTPGFE
jgi:hypothetical protein